MRRFSAAVLLSAVLVSFSCDAQHYTVTVENRSSKTVAYAYNGAQAEIPENDSHVYRVEAYTLPPLDISVPGAISVKMESLSSGERYVFRDLAFSEDGVPLSLRVTNTLDCDVKLRLRKRINDDLEYDYIQKTDGSLDTELSIPKPDSSGQSSSHEDAEIYTANPNFTAYYMQTGAFAVEFSPKISWEIEENVMKVLIESD
jgi:hypothetical protein